MVRDVHGVTTLNGTHYCYGNYCCYVQLFVHYDLRLRPPDQLERITEAADVRTIIKWQQHQRQNL